MSRKTAPRFKTNEGLRLYFLWAEASKAAGEPLSIEEFGELKIAEVMGIKRRRAWLEFMSVVEKEIKRIYILQHR